jgi:hypothetical protein
MFQGKGIGMSKVRRLATIVLVGGLCLSITAAPLSAQTLNDGGKIYGVADCRMATRSANVWVVVQVPNANLANGLYFYTEIWAKARFESKYVRISAAYSPLVKGTLYDPDPFFPGPLAYRNDPTTILFGSFTGSVSAYYDIHVMWWSRVPGGQWAGPTPFNLKGDSDSWITNYSNVYGDLGSPASDCRL